MPTKRIRTRTPGKPVGMLLGLLAGCMATIIGIVSNFDPFTILCRALFSGIAVGLTVGIGISVIRVANIPRETKANS